MGHEIMSSVSRRAFRLRKHGAAAILAAVMAPATLMIPAAARADDAPPSILDQIPQFASIDAYKKQLADKGLSLQLNYIADIFGNASGGQQTGAAYAGRMELVVDADLEKLMGIQGGAFHANGYWITGAGLTSNYVGSMMAVSNIEALPTVRLYELWYEQKFFDGKLGLRVGQLAADTEFALSKYGSLFINGTFGWPAIFASDLPSGGPGYPLATPGVRIKLGDDKDAFNVLMAVYNGNPAGTGDDNPQKRDAYGTNFTLQGPPLAFEEIQYRYNQDPKGAGLAGTVKIGSYQHFGDFSDQRYGDVSELSWDMQQAAMLRGNWSLYGVLDQQIYKLPDDGAKGIGFFARVMGTPMDRNVVDFYLDAGFNLSGFVPGRPDDVFGVGFAYAQISQAARDYDLLNAIYPVRDYEAVIEATYQYQLMPGWSLQPDFQYIMHPGGNVVDAYGNPAKNAVVIGMRTAMSF